MDKTIYSKLNKIQQELKAPKGQTNAFGNYKYRSCEDILEAVKPLLGDLVLTISDEMVQLGDRYYVKATATLRDEKGEVSNTAYARESKEKKGMDDSQITGATSSYARKYALNGLFAIDDTKDADTMDNSDQKTSVSSSSTPREIIGSCPKCGKPLKTKMTSKGEAIVCSTSGWDSVKRVATGCNFIKWSEPEDRLPTDEYYDKEDKADDIPF